MVAWNTHWPGVVEIPRFVVAPITDTSTGGTAPALPTNTFTFDGAAAPGEQFVVASVIAMCALEMAWGVVSMNGKAAPGASPASKELDAMNWLSSWFAVVLQMERSRRAPGSPESLRQ